MNASEWLSDALDRSGLGQAELARRMEAHSGKSFDRSIINKILKNKRLMSQEEAEAIAVIVNAEMLRKARGEKSPDISYDQISSGLKSYMKEPGPEFLGNLPPPSMRHESSEQSESPAPKTGNKVAVEQDKITIEGAYAKADIPDLIEVIKALEKLLK